MLDRLRDSLCHPSRLGLYYKDKLYMPFIYLISGFLLFIAVAFTVGLNEDYFTAEDSSYVVSMIHDSKNDFNLEFKDSRLLGSSSFVESDLLDAYFLDSSIVPSSKDKMTMLFNENEVLIYDGGRHIDSYQYNSRALDDFTFSSIKEGSIMASLAFKGLISHALDKVNSYYTILNVISAITSILMSYLFMLLIVVFFSYIVNNDLGMNIRMRICLYCTVIYFPLVIFSICFDELFLQVIGMVLPLIYARMAFSRIIRIRVKKG